jgi:hypothetical protein
MASRIALRVRAEAKRRRSLSRYLTERALREETTKPEPPREEIPELFEEVARLLGRYRAPTTRTRNARWNFPWRGSEPTLSGQGQEGGNKSFPLSSVRSING